VLVIVGVAVALILLVPIVAIAAVTLLGRSSTSKFEPVAPAVNRPVTTTEAPVFWNTWTSPSSSFSIDFPCPPTTNTTHAPGSTFSETRETTCEPSGGGAVYVVFEYDVPPGSFVNDPAALLEAMTNGIIKADGITALSNEPADFAGNPSRAIVTEQLMKENGTSTTLRLQGRVLVAGQKVYLIGAGGSASSPVDFDRFLSTFHIL